MATTIVGLKIRETRRTLGISQSELARQMGISPAYLNLIEFSKRRIGGSLLNKAAECLDLQPSELDGAAERRLASELHEIAADPQLQASGLGPANIEALIGRFPDWANALAQVYRSDQANAELVTALSDRLTHDPYLSDIVYQMLTHISAIRSTSEILDEIEEIEAPQRERFYRTLATESSRLTDVAQALAGYFNKAHTAEPSATPVEEVESFLLDHDNHFDEIESAADKLRDEAEAKGATAADLADMARSSSMNGPIKAVLGDRSETLSAVARRHIVALLKTYAADALLLPRAAFLKSAANCHYDLESLCQTWKVEFDRVCRRLTAISGRDDDGPRFAYLSANAAGNTIDRRPRFDLQFPRHGSACPLWSIYRAFAAPEVVTRQIAQFPDGQKVLFIARARQTGPVGFNRPTDYISDMVAVEASAANQLVYGEDLDFGARGKAEPVGPNCRICPRTGCHHRTDDPLVGRPQE